MEGEWLELEPALADRSKLRRRGSTMHLERHAIGEKKNLATPKVQRLQKSARKRAADVSAGCTEDERQSRPQTNGGYRTTRPESEGDCRRAA